MTTPDTGEKVFQPVKTALAISKKDFYEWHEQSYGDKFCSHPVTGYDIHSVKLSEENLKQFFDIPAALLVRPECETNEDFLQVLPYVVLRAESELGTDNINVYTYQRGKKGTEARLHGDYSIGFGGHIEEQPTKADSFLDVVIRCAQRELQEEVGLEVSRQQIMDGIVRGFAFHDTTNAVGKVHLSLVIVLDVEQKLTSGEEDQIDHVTVKSAQELREGASHGHIKMESWTSILINKLYNDWYGR